MATLQPVPEPVAGASGTHPTLSPAAILYAPRMEVRRISPDEWRLLRELRLASLADAPEAFGQTHAKAAEIPDADWKANARAASRGDGRVWFIARNGEGGSAGLVQARRRPPQDCLLFSMWVAPATRRSGMGTALIDAVEAWATGWGGRRIVLWVFGANEGAQRFYERIGFEVMPDGPDAESGKSFGAFAMQRRIGGG